MNGGSSETKATASAPEQPCGPTPAFAALVAVPLALLVMALLEPLQVPFDVFAERPGHLLRVPLLALPALLGICLLPIVLQLNVALVLAARPWSEASARALASLRAALAAAPAAVCYAALVEYEPFAGYPPFVALFVGLAVLLFFWSAALRRGARGGEGRKRALAVAAEHGPFALAAVGFPAVYAVNSVFLRSGYPTLHESALMVSFLLLHAALAAALARFLRGRRIPLVAVGAVAFLAIDLAAISPLLASTSFAARARPVFERYGLAGRVAASKGARGTGAPEGRRKIAPDHDAEARFAARSGMPPLPPDFDLARYNVLLVSVEAMRFDATSIDAAEPGNTPNLRRFAEGGFRFERAYTPSPYTMQVFSSIFSMTIASATQLEFGEKVWNGRLRDGQRTAAELLGANGWSTFAVSHDYRGLFRNFVKGLHQGFGSVKLMSARKDDPAADVRIAAEAIEALRPFAGGRGRFFGWVFFESPHYPYVAHYPEEPTDRRGLYDQEVRFADEQLGRVLDFLGTSGLLESTIVVVHGDHGEELGEHGGAQHNDVYAEVRHVPLVVRVPGVAGRRMSGTTSLTYLFPWLFLRGPEALRAEASRRLREEIGPLMQRTDGAAITEIVYRTGRRVALTWPERALVRDEDSGYFELYDTARDPGERRNIIDDDPSAESYRQRYARFAEAADALARWRMAASAGGRGKRKGGP